MTTRIIPDSPSTKHRLPDWLLVLAITIYPFLLIWQGGDLTDAGYSSLYSQDFFSDLNDGNMKSMMVLMCFIGNVWMTLFPDLGIWGLRLLSALFVQGSVLLAFLALRELRPRRVVLVGILCTQVFVLRCTAMVYGYDNISLFFLMLTAYCLWHGIRKASYRWLFSAGFSAGLASISRLPDTLILGLVPIVFLYSQWICQDKGFSKNIIWASLRQYAAFVLGCVTLFCFFGLILKVTGAWDVYLHNLLAVKDTLSGDGPSSSYTFLHLAKMYLKDLIKFLPYLLCVGSITVAFSAVLHATKKKSISYLLAIICIFSAFIAFHGGYSYNNPIRNFVPALCILPSIFVFLSHKSDSREYGPLVLIAWMVSLLCVAGTDTGLFLKLRMGMTLLMPLLGTLMWNRNVDNIQNIRIAWRPVVATSAAVIILISGMLRVGWIYHVDSGILCRLRAVHPVEHRLMRHIYTTEANAKHIEDVTKAVDRHIRPDNSLLIYGHQPLFYYLCQRKPVVHSFWMAGNAFTAETLFQRIEKSISKTSRYPMIVVVDEGCLGKEGANLLTQFFQKHQYHCVETSRKFRIWNTE